MASALIKYVALIVYIFLLVGIGVLISLKGTYKCKRTACIRKANFMLSNMNTSYDPCDRFYRYSCSNFRKIMSKLRLGEANVQTYISESIEKTLDSFLKDPIKVTDDRILKIIKKMYQPCVDPSLFNRQKTKPLWDAIWTSGAFPVVDDEGFNETEFTIGRFDERSRRSGFAGGHIFECYIAKDMKRPDLFVIHLSPPSDSNNPGHEIVSEQYSKKLYDNYVSFIVRLVFHLMGNENYEQDEKLFNKYLKELGDTVPFKINLYNFLKAYKREKQPIDLYNLMSVTELQRKFPILDWAEYFKNMLPTFTKPPTEVVVIGSSYFKDITKMVKNSEKRTMANYLMLENVLEACLFMPTVYFAIYNKFRINMAWQNVQRPSFCEKVVKQKLKGAISSLLLEGYNISYGSQDFLQGVAQKVVKDIKESISKKSSWMDDKTKKGANYKLKSLNLRLSLSDAQLQELTDIEARAKYYEDLCLGTRKSHVLPSYFCLNRFYFKKNWELLSRKPTVFDEDIDVITSFVRYIPVKNEVIIPYGVLTEPTYDGKWPSSINYGGFGSITAKTITDVLGTLGRNYDEFGFRNPWWTNETTRNYNKRAKCYNEKYADFVKAIQNVTIDTKSEKHIGVLARFMTSFSAIKLAYEAYKEELESRYLEQMTMPGMGNFTEDQLFFLSYANVNCGFYTKLKYSKLIQNADNIPRDFPVVTSLDDMEEFRSAFKCKPGSKMVSKFKCKLPF